MPFISKSSSDIWSGGTIFLPVDVWSSGFRESYTDATSGPSLLARGGTSSISLTFPKLDMLMESDGPSGWLGICKAVIGFSLAF